MGDERLANEAITGHVFESYPGRASEFHYRCRHCGAYVNTGLGLRIAAGFHGGPRHCSGPAPRPSSNENP
jgi:hypothetical protein